MRYLNLTFWNKEVNKKNFCFEHFSGMKKDELLMWAKFQNELFWGTRKKWTFRMKKNEKKNEKVHFFFIFFVVFSFFFILQIWSDMKVHSRNWLNMKVHFFPLLKFWSAGRFTLFDSLLFDFFWQFWKIRNRFFYYSFCF